MKIIFVVVVRHSASVRMIGGREGAKKCPSVSILGTEVNKVIHLSGVILEAPLTSERVMSVRPSDLTER